MEEMDEAVETELVSHEKWQVGIKKLRPELTQTSGLGLRLRRSLLVLVPVL